MEQQKLQNSTLILVLGIISLIGCCCYGLLGLIAGIITLILAKKATDIYSENPEAYSGFQNVKVGRVLAIIGLVLSVLYLILIIWLIAMFGWESLSDQDLMQDRLRELMD